MKFYLGIITGIVINFCLYSVEARAAIVSETLAQVGAKVITTRDMQISSVLDHWFLTSAGGAEAASKKIDKKDWWIDSKNRSEKFKNQLSILIIENLVILEADNFSVAKTTPAEITKYLNQISADLSDWTEWRNLELSPTELDTAIASYVRAKEFLKYKTDSMGFQISDAEAKEYYDKNRLKFNNLPFENFKESIREFLARKDVETRLKEWLEVLKKKYRVKILNQEANNA